jgi:hypothetical protein
MVLHQVDGPACGLVVSSDVAGCPTLQILQALKGLHACMQLVLFYLVDELGLLDNWRQVVLLLTNCQQKWSVNLDLRSVHIYRGRALKKLVKK